MSAVAAIQEDQGHTDLHQPYADIESPIEVDPGLDSGYEDDDRSRYTASLTSSVAEFQKENGRTYHSFREGKYLFPNDELEKDRLDLSHHLLTMTTNNRLYLAPIKDINPQSILDIGTGTGIWSIQMGDELPSATITGNDLSPIQPRWVPPNVKFLVDDVEDEWVPEEKFDYIHCRYMCSSIRDWPALVRNCYKHLKPGGWVEFQDYDLLYRSDDQSLHPEHHLMQWDEHCLKALNGMGQDPCPGPKLEGWVQDAGFTQITHRVFKMPVGAWPKDKHKRELGQWNYFQILEGLEAFSLAIFTRVLGWKPEELQVLLAGVRNDLKNPKIHSYLNFHVVYGRKPEEHIVE
ncbi:MAG: hypothetical protein M1823_006057 [Watsoniomyces obsoletus]|nr:MAG: hypothetical protein M1823_006057 [Watsoniomyces obsoletus]